MIKEFKFSLAVICGICLKLLNFFYSNFTHRVKNMPRKTYFRIIRITNIRIGLKRKIISLDNAVTVLKTLMFLIWENQL